MNEEQERSIHMWHRRLAGVLSSGAQSCHSRLSKLPHLPGIVFKVTVPANFALRKAAPIFALLILVLVVLCSVLGAEPIKQLKPTGYVNDFAGVIDSASAQRITNICEQIDRQAHAQIAVVTVRSLDGADIESYAVDLYKAWGIGPKSDNRGVLILLAVADRRYRVEVGYGLEPILPDGKVGGFGREVVPFLRQNQFGPALELLTGRVAGVIADDAHITLTGLQPTPKPQNIPRPLRSPFSLSSSLPSASLR